MMSLVLDQVLAHVRATFSRSEVATVQAYGGEFSAEEVDKVSYTCPAILIAVLGAAPPKHVTRLAGRHVRELRLAAFVVTKAARREDRMRQAMVIADKLMLELRTWMPSDAGQAVLLAPLEEEARAENLYGRAIDRSGQALWLVDWSQCARSTLPAPQLFDLLRVDIEETVREGSVPAADEPTHPITAVTDDVRFTPLPPNP